MKRKKGKSRRPKRISLGLALVVFLVVVAVFVLRSGYSFEQLASDFARTVGRTRATVTEKAEQLVRQARETQNAGEGPASPHVAVYFTPASHVDTDGVDDQLLAFLQGADKSILCAFYKLEWMDAAQVLIEQHRAGIAVKIVCDSDYADRDALRACIAAGIPAVLDERSALMHNKFCIVDGDRVWTGSMNVTENGLFRNDNNVIVVISPQLAANYTAEFGEMFVEREFGPRSPPGTAYPVVMVDDISFECYFAPEDDVRRQILQEIDGAGVSIDFMAFSFTSDAIAEAMAKRLAQGVAVRGVFESRNARSRHSDDEFLARQGAQTRLDKNPYTMHNKVIIIDGVTVVTGSYNFSNNAENDNDENVLIIHSPAVAERYERTFEKLFH